MRTEERPPAAGVPDYGRDVHCLLGLPVDAVDLRGALERIRGAAEQGARCFLSTPNVNFVVASRADAAFRQSVAHSDLSVADGMPLVWLARMLAVPLPERVAGASLFEALDEAQGARPLSVYFFGGGDGAAAAAAARLGASRRNLVCVGFESPGFGSVQEMSRPDVLQRINAARPDVLVVALGALKGQAWIEHNRNRLQVPVISHLGAVVDFEAGKVRRAPRWMQRSGFEWLWRIRERPALWRRYLGDAAALAVLFLFRVVPCALQRRWHRGRRRERCSVHVSAEARAYHVRLEGAWTRANAAPLRRCLAEASASARDVRLDMGAVTFLDSAVLGLLMLLAGHQRAHGRRLTIAPLPGRVRRLFDFSCAEYLYRDRLSDEAG